MTDSQIIESLTSIRGIGQWSVEMLLMFRLGRLHVMPSTDYGVRKGFALTYFTGRSAKSTKPADQLPTPKELLAHAECWRPYRSIGSWYMWRAEELHQMHLKQLKELKEQAKLKNKPAQKKPASKIQSKIQSQIQSKIQTRFKAN